MSDERQHINPWADKLQDISLPDEGLAWGGMQAMLDDELPQPKKTNNRRWILLIILLLLLLGVCNCPKGIRNGLYNAGNTDTIERDEAVGKKDNAGVVERDPDKYSAKAVSVISSNPADSVGTNRSSGGIEKAKLSTNDTVGNGHSGDDKNHGNENKKKVQDKLNSASPTESRNTLNTSGKSATDADEKNVGIQNKKPVAKSNASNTRSNQSRRVADISKRNKRVSSLDSSYGNADASVISRRKNRRKNNNDLAGSDDAKVNALKKKKNTVPNRMDIKQPSAETDTTQLLSPVNDQLAGTDSATVNAQKNKWHLIVKDSTKTADSLKIVKAIAKKDSLKIDSAKAEKGKKEKDTNKENGWATAIGLNQFFAIAGQLHSTLNSDGVTGTWKDYLPVPQVRYYFNRKLYVQLEAQFNAPQYTQTLLANFIPPDSSGNGIQTSVFVKKLFYFNLPLSVHYSPFKNFYLGVGLQCSRLSNGVGTIEEQRYSNGRPDSTNADIKTQSIKSDSVYKRIATTEFRWLADANYHLKNFTLGARYNQAFSNFINIQVSSTQLTQARNSSLQVYLRYTFWRSKKLKQNSIY